MISEVKEILSKSVEEVIGSSLSLKLLSCYSELYLNGAQPKTCSDSQRQYYQQLSKNGIKMAEQLESKKDRACKPAWNGIRYIPQMARHYNSELITDDEAKILLKKKILDKSDFEILPEDDVDFSEAEINLIVEIAEQLKAGVTKKAIREKYKDVEMVGEKPLTSKLIDILIKEAEKTL